MRLALIAVLTASSLWIEGCEADGVVVPRLSPMAGRSGAWDFPDTAAAQLQRRLLTPGPVYLGGTMNEDAGYARTIASVPVPGAWGIAIRGDGLALVTSQATTYVYLLDAHRRIVTDSIDVGEGSNSVVFTQDGSHACLGVPGGAIGVIDVTSKRMVSLTPIEYYEASLSAVLTRDGRYCVVGTGHGRVLLFDPLAPAVVASIQLPSAGINGLAIDSSGTRIYASDSYTHSGVFELDYPSLALRRSFRVRGVPQALIVTSDGTHLLVANERPNAGYVSNIDLSRGDWVDTPTAGPAFGLVDIPWRDQAAVLYPTAWPTEPGIQVFSFPQGSISRPYPDPRGPRRGVVFAPDRVLIVTAFQGGTVDFMQ
ncbi:MAG: hypothetical protein U0132_08805 [Gemmatimonadaceae bacterium]